MLNIWQFQRSRKGGASTYHDTLIIHIVMTSTLFCFFSLGFSRRTDSLGYIIIHILLWVHCADWVSFTKKPIIFVIVQNKCTNCCEKNIARSTEYLACINIVHTNSKFYSTRALNDALYSNIISRPTMKCMRLQTSATHLKHKAKFNHFRT